MSRTRQISLRRGLLLRLLAPLLTLLLISGVGTYWLALHFSNQVYDAWLYDSVNSLALLVDREGDHASCDLPVAAEEIFLWDETDSIYFTVRGERSGILAANAQLPDIPAGATRYRDAYLDDVAGDARAMRMIALELDAERAGERVWVQVAETGTKRQRLAQTIFLAVLLPQIGLIAAATIAVNLGVLQGLKPLARLSKRLGAQNPTRLQPVPDAGVPEEVLPLTQALNALLAGLHEVMEAQRTFIANAAHQLRTPLTGIKLNSERAIREQGSEPTPTLQQLCVSADRAARLANQLLSLARAESGLRGLRHTARVDVLALARERGAEWVPRALSKNLELSLQCPEDKALVTGDPLLIGEALDNLLDNAIKYHDGPGSITVDISPGERTRIAVDDNGPGIAPELQARVFDRFNRGARVGSNGNGLGLSIVAEIASALMGRAWIETGASGRGTRAVLELPGVPDSAGQPR
jgi:two-component system sensor histidine kinase TctE